MTDAALTLDGVVHRYGDLVMRFDLAVEAGEFLTVIGPSGAGKSTLLDLAAGFLKPDAGRILIAGTDVTDVPPAGRPLSMVFQDNNLFAHLDVFRNVALGLSPRRRVGEENSRRVREAIAAVGLAGFERRRPADMSGGERQRVTLARAFLRDRPLLLLDEPFAALGPALRREMLELIQALRRLRGGRMAIVMVTHQPDDARGFADRIAFLDEGRIAAIGATDAMLAETGDGGLSAYLGR
ncbi:thiamine import ATP-binding protein ThiQ [Aureimonas sp. SA4125]|uniref:thiamine ABC transporter ATP-binding protein n=1 Tax=Aureimonas sp. SA4125 TaxID=2826993 RepID=UPI001CC81B7A|nr:ATP-binding cassette domain-containing protein [Aureimonas sp. SA4125]BDA86225.1 thiamine import ATP-binding protein ThiQ [Aureimonas sp. SA4125]